jgi:hypothetical protein
MSSSLEHPIDQHAFWPTAAVFALWSLVSLGILAVGEAPVDPSTLYNFLVPLFSLLFIILIASSCALFTLYQEFYFVRRPGLRRIMIFSSLALGVGLAVAMRNDSVPRDPASVLASANLIVFALLIGNYLPSALKRPSELVPVCIVMSVADLFSVFAGPSKRIAASVETYYLGGQVGPVPWSDFLLVKIAVPGIEHTLPVFGVADVIILSFLTAAAGKFKISDNLAGPGIEEMRVSKRPAPYLPVAALGLACAVLAAQFLNVFLPALPVMGLFFLAFTLPRYPRMRQLQRTEWVAVIVGCAVFFGLTAASM